MPPHGGSCSNCPGHTFITMTDPFSSPLAPAPIAELIVAPVQTFGGDTKRIRAAFFQARALLFAAVSSEARTLGVVKCGGDGNGRVCAYVRLSGAQPFGADGDGSHATGSFVVELVAFE